MKSAFDLGGIAAKQRGWREGVNERNPTAFAHMSAQPVPASLVRGGKGV